MKNSLLALVFSFPSIVLAQTFTTSQDIGAVGGAGSSSFSNGVYTITGSGAEIYNTSDEFRTPRLPDSDRIWFALGAQWKVAPATVIDFGYSYIHVKDASSRLRNQETPTSTLLLSLRLMKVAGRSR